MGFMSQLTDLIAERAPGHVRQSKDMLEDVVLCVATEDTYFGKLNTLRRFGFTDAESKGLVAEINGIVRGREVSSLQ